MMMVDSLHSSRTVRPGGAGRKMSGQADRAPTPTHYKEPVETVGADFDDDMPF
jgi:hypothetical protein